MNQSDEEVIRFARELIESNNAINWQKANELSFLMRRSNRNNVAVAISRMMYEKDSTVDKLNLYFVAVVDQGNIEEIRRLHRTVDEYISQHGNVYQKHLFATWLKAANRILDDDMFEYIYRMVPSAEKVENSYIISQYYVYLNRHSRYVDVKEHYEKELAPHIQSLPYVNRYYNNACARLGYFRFNLEVESQPSENNKEKDNAMSSEDGVAPSASGSDAEQRVFLVYGNKPPELGMIKFFLKANEIDYIDIDNEASGGTILQKFEAHASESNFAIVLLTPSDHVVRKGASGINEDVYYPRQNVVLEWGYFLGRLGKDNIAVLLQEQGRQLHKDFIVPSDMLGTEHISMSGNWIPRLSQRLKKKGFAIKQDL